MLKTTETFENLKIIALNTSYSETQVNTALNALKKSTLLVILKENKLFDIIDTKNNETIHADIKIDLVMEICHDCLRNELENYLKQENIDLEYANSMLTNLNDMFENNPKYIIKNMNKSKYLALNI